MATDALLLRLLTRRPKDDHEVLSRISCNWKARRRAMRLRAISLTLTRVTTLQLCTYTGHGCNIHAKQSLIHSKQTIFFIFHSRSHACHRGPSFPENDGSLQAAHPLGMRRHLLHPKTKAAFAPRSLAFANLAFTGLALLVAALLLSSHVCLFDGLGSASA